MADPLYDPARVGGDVLSWCTKCKMDLAHVVIAMVGPRPAKVICKTCKSTHNFKPAQGDPMFARLTSASKKPRAAAAPKTYMRAADYWEKKMGEKKAAPMLPYDVKQKFGVGDVIRHNQFGVGIVEEVKNGGKIVVIFREGERTLVHELVRPASA